MIWVEKMGLLSLKLFGGRGSITDEALEDLA